MGHLIDDLLTFSRLGRAEMHTRPVDVNVLVEQVQQELQPEVANRHITWQIEPLPTVQADPALLKIVWINLLLNAIKYTAPRPKAHIGIGTMPADNPDEAIIFVRDNGVGFNPHYSYKLFGVFQRLHRAEEFEGTGIGLATVRRIINRHGGRVWAESEMDKGAVFYFTLDIIGNKVIAS